jgi:uncharacterized membrane protein YhaH (DUF805 family)
MKWFIDGLKNYFNFNGRASRKAYWMFVLFNIIFGWVAIALDNIFGTAEVGKVTLWGVHTGAFSSFYSLILLLPSLAIVVRRLHDIGKKSTWFFIVFIPIVGWIWILVLMIREGDLFDNEFGPIPQHDFDNKSNSGNDSKTPNNNDTETIDPDPTNSASLNDKDNFDVQAIRKEAEDKVAKEKIAGKQSASTETKKIEKGKDKGAVDFR